VKNEKEILQRFDSLPKMGQREAAIKLQISNQQKIGLKLNDQKLFRNIRPTMYIMPMKLDYFIVPYLSIHIYSKIKMQKAVRYQKSVSLSYFVRVCQVKNINFWL